MKYHFFLADNYFEYAENFAEKDYPPEALAIFAEDGIEHFCFDDKETALRFLRACFNKPKPHRIKIWNAIHKIENV